MEEMSPEQMQKSMEKWRSWIGQLSNEGKVKGGDPLDTGGSVLTGKDKTLRDGPFAESKDVVGGYLVVTADTLEAATDLATGCPIFDRGGSVEVRRITPM